MQINDSIHAFLWRDPTANNCNTYLIDGTKRILVDPGHYHLFGHVRDHLLELSLSTDDIDVVIVTHGHPDHMEAVKIFADTQTMIALHQEEMAFIREVAPHYGMALGIADFEPHILLGEGSLNIGDMTFQVIDTPGHSPGSICLHWPEEKALFTGDLVFHQGLGRTDLPGGSGEILKKSIKKISELDVDLLLPGHGEILTDPDLIRANFHEIERVWFAYL
jgi:glyoxylase-like metal-dependent hydrolase (beta-lactamase superfamily II)